MVVKSVFNLTEEGKKVYAADTVHQMGYGTIGGLCFGKVTVKEIAEFTEPSDAMGRRISHVSYTFVVTDFPAWAKSPEILAALPDLKKSVESENTPIKHQAMLVLTNNGWAPPR